VGFGTKLPAGHLPVFSVDTAREAKDLIIATRPMGMDGKYYARELIAEQTLDNLQKFSDRLAAAWRLMQDRKRSTTKRGSRTHD
jgi:hypothetical protein